MIQGCSCRRNAEIARNIEFVFLQHEFRPLAENRGEAAVGIGQNKILYTVMLETYRCGHGIIFSEGEKAGLPVPPRRPPCSLRLQDQLLRHRPFHLTLPESEHRTLGEILIHHQIIGEKLQAGH